MAEVLTHFVEAPSPRPAEAGRDSGEIISRPVPEGFRTWLPAIFVLVCTPMMALIFAKYGLVPSLKHTFARSAFVAMAPSADKSTGALYFAQVPLNTPRSHPGFRSLALVAYNDDFKAKIDENKALLSNLASSELRDTTVSDLDKPGELDAMRYHLLTEINQALGGQIVRELYIAEWPR